jgi:hypothetical protein
MTPQAAADAAGISRQGLMKQIRQGNFRAGGIEFIGRRDGKKWDVMLAAGDRAPQAAMGSLGGRPPGVPNGGGQAPPMEALRAKRLWTQIKLDEQKLAEHDRQLRMRFAECVRNAIQAAGADFAGKARALRLPPEMADQVGKLGQGLKDEFKQRFQEEYEEWEKSLAT